MTVGMKNAMRARLTGQKIKMGFLDAEEKQYVYDVEVEHYLGEGNSCICYEVMVYKNKNDTGQKRVLKQFYPDPRSYEIDTEMDGMRLDIKGYSDDKNLSWNREINRLGEFFERAYKRQITLSNKKELSGVIVRPELCHFDGATKYVLYESDYGRSMDFDRIHSLEEFIHKMYDLAFALQQLHRQGIIYMDLKPANILISGNGKIKLFDFDAVIDKNHMEDVHMENDDIRYDVENIQLIAPEIRPDKLVEFEQDKSMLLHERVDIYSFGAIMLSFFLHRYPTEEDCTSAAFKKELSELLNSRFRGELTEEEAEKLSNIIWKCIQKDIGPGGRYHGTEKLVHDLSDLKKMVSAPALKRRRVYGKVNGRLQAAYVMDKYPLSGYRRLSGSEWVMDSLIIGNDPVSEDFFMNILACSQMLHTKHVIRLALSSAEEKVKEYIKKWPMLTKTVRVFLNDVPAGDILENIKTELDPVITETPFAELRFYEWNGRMDIPSFYSGLKSFGDISWVAVSDSKTEQNMETAEKIAAAASSGGHKLFIAYLDDRGDGYDLRQPDKKYGHITLFPFGSNSKFSEEEEEFQTGIKKRALLLHKYYMREWNERADAVTIRNDYLSDAYKFNSSLCSVLSIPYKLESVGIKTSGREAAAEYQRTVLDENSQMARSRLNQLIYLEHRRWMCFMLTESYDRPSINELKHYAFTGKNDQRNKTDRLHLCICGCGEENGICLDTFPRKEWDNPDYVSYAKRNNISLDQLDRMSVQFHQLCSQKIARMEEDGEFETALAKLERAMKAEEFEPDDYEMLDSVKAVYRKMLDNEANVNSLWEKTCACFSDVTAKKVKNFRIHTGDTLEAFKEFKNLMRVVVERNNYHDYKSSDRTILEILPLLLISGSLIRRIHKPVSEKSWQNIASSLIIEPEQLYLYTDDADFETDYIKTFLKEKRGISIDTIIVRKTDELKNLSIAKNSVKSVLDITGLSAEEAYRISHMDNLEHLPVIFFKDGKIHSLSGESEADYYKALRRHMTVGETFRLYHANIYSESSQNHMLGLVSSYEDIWDAYTQMNSFRYKVLVETLNKIEQDHYWRISARKGSESICTFEKKRVPDAMIQDAGIAKVLNKLSEDKWIEKGYRLPGIGQFGTVIVKTRSEDIRRYLDRMFQTIEKHPYMHKFIYIKTRREPLTGKPSSEELYYIYDDTLVVDEIVDDKIVDTDNKTRRKDVLEKALELLKGRKSKGGEPAVDIYGSRDSQMIETIQGKDSQFRMVFLYRSRAVRECLMKEGNILETYVYFSIWKNTLVDDVRLNVAFTWDAEKPDDALEKGAITNEIDLVCTRNMQTYCISCKQSMPRTEYLQEIKYFADYFGIDGKAILVTSNNGTNGKRRRYDAELISARSQKMQVYYINRQMLGDTSKEEYLAKYFQNIFDGKKDWTNIDK